MILMKRRKRRRKRGKEEEEKKRRERGERERKSRKREKGEKRGEREKKRRKRRESREKIGGREKYKIAGSHYCTKLPGNHSWDVWQNNKKELQNKLEKDEINEQKTIPVQLRRLNFARSPRSWKILPVSNVVVVSANSIAGVGTK